MTHPYSSFAGTRLFFGLALGTLIGCSRSDTAEAPPERTSNPTEEQRIAVDPSLLEQGRVAHTDARGFAGGKAIIVPGEVVAAPDGEAEIGSLVGGRVASLDAVEGTNVTKGQVLAWIISAEIGAARAELTGATSRVAAAYKRLERQLALESLGATSQRALDEARADVQTAEAERQAVHARLIATGAAGEGVRGRVPLRSPIDGVVVARHAKLGGAVAAETTLFRVVDHRRLRVKAHWSESLGVAPNIGAEVELVPRRQRSNVDEGSSCRGSIDAHLGVIEPKTRSFELRVLPDATCTGLTIGAYVDVLATATILPVDAESWVEVPLESVVDLRGIPTVFVATERPGEFEVRRVVPGPSLGGVIPIEVGLSVGERVASKGVILLKGEALRNVLGGD